MDGPSVSTPFLRRWFVNEGVREARETAELYRRVAIPNPYAAEDIAKDAFRGVGAHITEDMYSAFMLAILELVEGERYMFECPAPVGSMTLAEQTDYRNFLRHREYYLQNAKELSAILAERVSDLLYNIARQLPQTHAPSPFTIPLIYALPEPGMTLTQTHNGLLEDKIFSRGLLRGVAEQSYANICSASGLVPHTERRKPFKHAWENDLPLDELNDTYMGGTPFHNVFTLPVPLKFDYADRFNHMHVVGGTGAGKTTLLKNLILHDLASGQPPALVIVDSQGDLIRELSHLRVFAGPLADKFVLVTPKDIEHPPALNVFDVNRSRLGSYDQLTKEQVIAGVIQTFDYLFSGLLGADLTAKQGVFFKYVARLMLSVRETMGRNATILDMLELMENPAVYAAAIQALLPLQRNFFERDFTSKTFAQTKEQIRYRLQAIIENPTLARLFTSPETKIDLFEELNRGAIILVDTSRDFLKGASSHFGRIFIALVLQAVLERAAIPESERYPAFLIVDEAASYFDSNIDDLLTEARKYRLGCVFAHQYLDQATAALRASLAANTGIKFAAGLSMADARQMAPDMRTTADFILSQRRLHFAAHIRNVTPQAVSIPVEVGLLEAQPSLSREEYDHLLQMSRQRVSLNQQLLHQSNAMPHTRGSDPAGALALPDKEPHPPSDTAASEDW